MDLISTIISVAFGLSVTKLSKRFEKRVRTDFAFISSILIMGGLMWIGSSILPIQPLVTNDLFYLTISLSFGGFLAIYLATRRLKRWIRKAIHIYFSAIVASLVLIDSDTVFSLVSYGLGLLIMLEYLRKRSGFFPRILRKIAEHGLRRDEREAWLSGIFWSIGTLIVLFLFESVAMASLVIMASAFADTAGAIVGTKYGKHELWHNRRKTFEGSFACFVAMMIFFLPLRLSLPALVISASIMAFVESVGSGVDNMTLPVMMSFLIIVQRGILV